jgi:hypothetical protein
MAFIRPAIENIMKERKLQGIPSSCRRIIVHKLM